MAPASPSKLPIRFVRGFVAYGVTAYDDPKVPEMSSPHLGYVADRQVNDLWERYLTHGEDIRRWENVSEIIDTSLRLIPDIRFLFDWQGDNRQVYGVNESFLYDIARFLSKGRRDLELDNALSLVESYPSSEVFNKHRSPLDEFSWLNKVKGPEYIETWLFWDSGLEDLLTSLYLLFGASRR